MIENDMTILPLELVAVILVSNEPGLSVFNPVECVFGADSISLSVLAVCRELAAFPEVEAQT